MDYFIHWTFETFVKCIATADGGLENYLLRIFFLVSLFCLQQEQLQLHGNFDMEIFRVVMIVKLLQSSEIRILGVSSET